MIPDNYGTTFVPTFEEISLTKNNLIKMSLDKKQEVSDFLFEFYRNNGFPYPKYHSLKLKESWKEIKKLDSTIIENNHSLSISQKAGVNLFKHFADNFFQAKSKKNSPSLLEAFNDDRLLIKTINNRIGLTFSETFTICGNMIRQGLRNSGCASPISMFSPAVAKFIYDKFAPENGTVFDFSVGFGQRLIGALASNKNLHYIGCDPWKETICNVNKIGSFISEYQPDSKFKLYEEGAENFILNNQKFDLAFSSPCYFSREIYSSDSSQAYFNKSYYQFISEWFQQVVENIDFMLKPNGIIALNMMEQYQKHYILDDMLAIFKSKNYIEIDRYYLKLLNTDNWRTSKKIEPIVIMKKI